MAMSPDQNAGRSHNPNKSFESDEQFEYLGTNLTH